MIEIVFGRILGIISHNGEITNKTKVLDVSMD